MIVAFWANLHQAPPYSRAEKRRTCANHFRGVDFPAWQHWTGPSCCEGETWDNHGCFEGCSFVLTLVLYSLCSNYQ